ncbi:MAG: tetratricopeptide repeat protein [candidate division WOR-3 bacterium]
MAVLVVVVIILVVVALYPVVRDLVRRRPGAAPAYVEGLQYMLDNRLAEAFVRFKEAVAADPSNVDAYVRLGDVLIKMGETERGVKVHENLALRRNLAPADETRVLRALTRDYLATDRKLKAVSSLEELIRLDPHDMRATEELFRLYLATASWDKCEKLVRSIGHKPPDRTWAALLFAELGRARAAADPKLAHELLATALRLDRNSIAARLYSGDLEMSEHNTEAAIRNWMELLELAPDRNVLVRERLETAFYESGRYDEIIQVYERLLRKVPDDEGLTIALAEIYRKREDLVKAIRLLERFGKPGTRTVADIALATLLFRQGQSERAMQVLEAVNARLRTKLQQCSGCGADLSKPGLGCEKCRAMLR